MLKGFRDFIFRGNVVDLALATGQPARSAGPA
jgi:large-conductance mechanosensitive channel